MNKGNEAGAKMAKLRKEKRLTQTELAQVLNVSQRMVAACELGERRPSVGLARRIATELGMAWTDFFEDGDSSGEWEEDVDDDRSQEGAKAEAGA